jgi:signal transduction histidine kinase
VGETLSVTQSLRKLGVDGTFTRGVRPGGTTKGRTLARQLVGWFLLLTLAPLALLTLVASWDAATLLRRAATNGLVAAAERQSGRLESLLEERQTAVAALACAPSIGDALLAASSGSFDERGAAAAALRAFLTGYQSVSGWDDVLLVTPKRRVAFSTAGSAALGTELAGGGTGLAVVVERALMTLGADTSDLALHAGAPGAWVAAPVLRDGVLAGVLAVRSRDTEIDRVVNDTTGLGATGETVLTARVGGEAVFLAPTRHDPKAAFARRVRLLDFEPSDAELVRGRIRTGTAVDYRGERVLAVWTFVPEFRWTVLVKIDEAEALAPVARFRLLSALVGIPLVLVVVAAALSVARSISGPIERLTAATRAFADGDLSHRIPLETHNEIRLLGASFNRMGGQLQATIAELERYGHTLEERVHDRTAELSEKNRALEDALANLSRAQEQILVQEKLASLGALTAGIAHEIKNPLNFVNNFSLLTGDLVKDLSETLGKEKEKLDPAVWDEVRGLLADISQNAAKVREHGTRADAIVRSMLLHARARGGERQPTDINALVNESVGLAHHAARGRDPGFTLKVETRLDPAAGSIAAVPQDLTRVFVNLVANACDALDARRRRADGSFQPLLEVTTAGRGDAVEIRVKDNGGGIPRAVLDRIFEPFFTTKPPGKGTGLGLSISREIVTKGHGGTLEVETAEGSTTEVVVRLPR